MTDFTNPDSIDVISEADAVDLQRRGVLAMNPDRSLPLWFDGRFLSARDLNRQQNYFLSRQGTLGRSVGSGVIEGLGVRLDDTGPEPRILIAPGQGIAFDGAHIHLPVEMSLHPANLAVQNALNARLGLTAHPSSPVVSRTGLFVLSLRLVEYTANQTTSFPTSVTGERSTHMGDRIEAVAATLTPYAPTEPSSDSADARAQAAYRIFREDGIEGLPSHALPVAMMALRNGTVEWVDVHMVRRELGASGRGFLGLGLGRDQLRLAHLHQYRTALRDIMAHYAASSLPARFPADQHFRLLPPAGPLPADTVLTDKLAQVFFPGEVEVELSIIPDDELPALIEESLDLPPIDLTRPVEERDTLSVLIVAPMPRHALRSQLSNLGSLTNRLSPLAMLGQGPQKPLDRLKEMKIKLADASARGRPDGGNAGQVWASVIEALTSFGLDGDSTQRTLWYMRRRTLRRSADLESVLVAVSTGTPEEDIVVPDPGTPVTDPTDPAPVPPPVTITDEGKLALIKLAGFGDLAKIAEAQLDRVTDEVEKVFAKAILESNVVEDPVSTAALVARMAGSPQNAHNKLEASVVSILKANAQGRALISTRLIGLGSSSVSRERFEDMVTFLEPDTLFETFADAVVKLDTDRQKEVLNKLGDVVADGDEADVKDLTEAVKAMADAPAPVVEPAPVPVADPEPTGPAPNVRDEASRKAARKLLEQVTDSLAKSSLEKAMNKATTEQRETIVELMTVAKIVQSRIATHAAAEALKTGGTISSQNIKTLKAIDNKVVGGLKVFEPHILSVEAPAQPAPSGSDGGGRGSSGSGIGAAVRGRFAGGTFAAFAARNNRVAIRNLVDATAINFNRANILANLGDRTAKTVENRLQLLGRSSALRAMAVFGAKNKNALAKIKKTAGRIVAVLDKPGISQIAVDKEIKDLVGGDD